MKKNRLILLILIMILFFGGFFIILNQIQLNLKTNENAQSEEEQKELNHPIFIETMKSVGYPGSSFVIEKKLANGSNYQQMIVSYLSEGLTIYGLLTIPLSRKPEKGFPAIVFIHGYIPPRQYSTTGNYPTYQARLARAGFITFKPDLRGHGDSEGSPVSAHYSEKYVVDTLYAISYLKGHEDVNPERIGYWGHSNGGEIGLRVVVISPDIKAASFWAGVVGSYEDMWVTYNEQIPFLYNRYNPLIVQYGLPGTNPDFWEKADPYFYLSDITAPIELQHGTADKSVPVVLSQRLKEELENNNIAVAYYEYPGDNHNISKNVNLAFKRSIEFYRKHL
ncbi:MAG: alpha/beta fold hydrolase [Spirochaetes bacterium]|nr:alpha/beta fold hydrolase [Spirochaetota bacterium]